MRIIRVYRNRHEHPRLRVNWMHTTMRHGAAVLKVHHIGPIGILTGNAQARANYYRRITS